MKPKGICKARGCTNPTSQRSKNRFSQYCSNRCASAHVLAARKKTWLERYGVDNPAKTAEVRKKISDSVHSYRESIGLKPIHRRPFKFQPPTVVGVGKDFYVYALLDPRKPGAYSYGHWKFDHEPFYVGKGFGNRAWSHIKDCGKKANNSHKDNRIRIIMRETGQNPIVCIKRQALDEASAFLIEVKLIWSIGRRDQKLGPLTNKTDGGEGIVGHHWSHKKRQEQSVRVKEFMQHRSIQDKRRHSERVSQSNKASWDSGRRKNSFTYSQYRQALKHLGFRIELVFPDLLVLRDTKQLHQCYCGHVWETKPSYLLSRKLGCPECRRVDPVIQNQHHLNRSTANLKAHRKLTPEDKAMISKKLSSALKESWSTGKLSSRRV